MNRTPESIATAQHAAEIGTSMLALLNPNTSAYEVCESGLETLEEWIHGKAKVGECRESALKVHGLARLCQDSREKNAIRCIGHAIATAHVSNHLKACEQYCDKALTLD